jgi:hypothetical protein
MRIACAGDFPGRDFRGDALDAGVAVVCALPAAVVTLTRSTW